MPIYEYQCTQCGEKLELRQSFGEDASKLGCPKCQAPNPQKVFSSFFSPSSTVAEPSLGNAGPSCTSGICGLPPM